MTKIHFLTRYNTSTNGKQRVYFSAHPKDFSKYFAEISNDILSKQNCAIYYYLPEDVPSH